MTTTAVPTDERARTSRHAVRAMALVPAGGAGGERDAFAAAVLEVLDDAGLPVDVIGGTGGGSAAMLSAAVRRARSDPPSHVLCFHPALAPVAAAAHRAASGRAGVPPGPVLVFFAAADVGGPNLLADLVLRRTPVRLIATDSSAATALSARYGPVGLLRPGVDRQVYRELSSLDPSPAPSELAPPRLMTLVPLDRAERSGALTLLRAGELVRARHPGLEVTVAGPGRPSPALLSALSDRASWARALESTALADLRAAYARAHLFALGTPEGASRPRGDASDEFGIALVHAQLAAVPVIAPTSGAAGEAYVEGVTGLRPADPSAEALAACIGVLLDDESALQRAARSARLWATSAFLPERFARRVRQVVLGAPADPPALTPLSFLSPVP